MTTQAPAVCVVIHVLMSAVIITLAVTAFLALVALFSVDLPDLPDHLDEGDWS